MKKILILIFFFTIGCGYQPIYLNEGTKNYTFKKITLIGNNKINERIVSALNLKIDMSGKSDEEVIINSDINIYETSKNSKGQVASYRTSIKLNYKIKNNEKIIKNKNLTKSFSYNNKKNKFKLVEYQKDIEKSLTKKIIEELIIDLNL
tara:strand:+ start:1908 stop:2354 length:447 start_codon:yes stop_codon:yes gene_type:complete